MIFRIDPRIITYRFLLPGDQPESIICIAGPGAELLENQQLRDNFEMSRNICCQDVNINISFSVGRLVRSVLTFIKMRFKDFLVVQMVHLADQTSSSSIT